MREVMMGLAATGMVGGGVWYSGALDGGEFYPMAPSDVAHELALMDLPAELEGALGADGLVRLKTSRKGDEEVRWDVILNGQPVAKFVAALAPADGGTKVKVDFELSDSKLGRSIGRDTPMSIELVQTLTEIALAEQVDATLEHRPFDQTRVANAAAGWIATHPAQAMEFGAKMTALADRADPEMLAEMRESIEANLPLTESGPYQYGDGYRTDPAADDYRAMVDQYEAAAPMDEN